MRRGEETNIKVDGKIYLARYVGKGKFSRVFQIGNRVIYYTRGDCAKEVISMYQHERMMHLPEIIRHDNTHDRRGNLWYVFSSPFYRDVTTKDRSAYELMKRIIKYFNDIHFKYWAMKFRGIDLMNIFVNSMEEDGRFPRSVVKALRELVDVSSNCGDQIAFDFHKKNFGVNEYGVLIFRDVVYVK